MGKYEKDLKDEIMKFIETRSRRPSDWYIGVSADPQKALFKVHKVDKKKDAWWYNFAETNLDAARVAETLLMTGFDGDAIRHDAKATGVYIYRKTAHTKQ